MAADQSQPPLPQDWRAVLEELGQPVVVTEVIDPRGRIAFWNRAAERTYGYSAEEAIGAVAVELLVPVVPRDKADAVISNLRAGRPWQGEFPLRRRDGTTFPAFSVNSGVYDENGTLTHVVAVTLDLTELRQAQEQVALSEARWRSVVSRSADVAIISDAATRLTWVAPAAERILGWTPEHVLERRLLDLVHPDDQPAVTAALAHVLDDPTMAPVVEFRLLHLDGGYRWVEETITNLLDDPAVGGLVGNLRDITDRKMAHEALRRSEARYRAMVETAQEGVLVIGRDGLIAFVNERFAELVGRPREQLLGQRVQALSEEYADLARDRLQRRRAGLRETYELSFHLPDGTPRHLLVSASPLTDEVGGFAGSLAMCADITDRKQAETELSRLAMRDPLTGLANRTLLAERLAHALGRLRRHEGAVAVLFVDLDQFKSVNDSLGHAAGDDLLVIVAQRIAATVRSEDTVARFGGDEFVVLADELRAPDEADRLAERVLAGLQEPVEVAGLDLSVSASIGIAVADAGLARALAAASGASRLTGEPDELVEELLRQADVALYTAKAAGRACWSRYETETVDAREQLQLLGELRRSVAADQLRLYYQPVVELATGRLVGAEALLRWAHPTRGLLSPSSFIPLAETSGLIGELDLWALRVACRQAVEWGTGTADALALSVSVNLSARHLMDRQLPAKVTAALAETGLAPNALVLELTETAVMSDADTVLGVLHALRGLGVRLAIDDFGTGYSSLVYLERFPVDELEVDRSFVDGLGQDAEDTAIVTSVLGLADALGLRVVAEGVETDEQRAALERLGCSLGQGYLWSPPLPAEEFRQRWLASGALKRST